MKISFPAMQGTIGQRDYYSCLMKLNVIPKMFTFRDWTELLPEDREQRVLNKSRVPVIARYMLDNEDGYLFSSITASYKCDVKFKQHGESGLGTLEMDLDDANFVINDGQHRCAAIAYAIKENPALGDETISVLLFPYESRGRVQQMFSDLNRFVAKTSKSLDILYDKRDPLSKVALELSELVPIFRGLVDKEAVSLPIRSPKLFSLSAIYDSNQELLRHMDGGEDRSINEMLGVAAEYWTAVAAAMPSWQKVKAGEQKAVELRQESIASHSTVLRALGAVGAELMKEAPTDWKERVNDLKSVNWSKKNKDWEGVCIVANSVVSNRQARLATKAYLKRHLELSLTSGEERALMPPAEFLRNLEIPLS